MKDPKAPYLALLDAMRGILALWVVVGHCEHYTKASTPLPPPGLAVDQFMLLSGFLMVLMYRSREEKSPVRGITGVFAFYLRRFFRIAPLYYFLLIIGYLLQAQLGQWTYETDLIEKGLPLVPSPPVGEWNGEWSSGMVPYSKLDWLNVTSHFTFIFGFIPALSNNNALPDWSIGLEMQFYLFFPLLMMVVRKWGYLALLVPASFLFYRSAGWFGWYLEPGALLHFGQPTFLPLKINIFLIGMLLGEAKVSVSKGEYSACAQWLLGAIVLLFIKQTFWLQIAVLFLGLWVVSGIKGGPWSFGRLFAWVDRFSSHSIFRHLANASYSIYLAHLMILVLVRRVLAEVTFYQDLEPLGQFAVLSVLAVSLSFGAGSLLYRFIERPGINFGRTVVSKWTEARG